MNPQTHAPLVALIWRIADDCLRDIYNRGKYRDVILPMTVLRRLDALLEDTKVQVLAEAELQRDQLRLLDLEPRALQRASGYLFYNTSPWTLKKIVTTATNSRQQLQTNVLEYLDGFSPNIQEIIQKFALREHVKKMAEKNVLLEVIEKFTSDYLNLTPEPRTDPEGRQLPPLTNHGMGYVFEELIRKFNEENNEEAGEHFTPREVIHLMTHLVFDPVAEELPAVVSIYDPACGSGGMLTESESLLRDPEKRFAASAEAHTIYLYGKEINDETYALCKSDMIIKGGNPEHIRSGSTLTKDEFAGDTFDFMLSNPPYGKSWSSELKHIKDGKDVIDDRFRVSLTDYYGVTELQDATPRSSDGQLLFLMEMWTKVRPASGSSIGSRIATVHNGSSLFTGSAGGGESNIRRYLIENDRVEAILQLPNNIFYNTGISTYIWLLSNRKAPERRGKLQLIDASKLYDKLRKNLGQKNCELSPKHIATILDTYRGLSVVEPITPEPGGTAPEGVVASLVFDNAEFGYYAVTIERPERLRAQFTPERVASLRFDRRQLAANESLYAEYGDQVYEGLTREQQRTVTRAFEDDELGLTRKNLKQFFDPKVWKSRRELMGVAQMLLDTLGSDAHLDFNAFVKTIDAELKQPRVKLSAGDKRTLHQTITEYDEAAEKVIKRVHTNLTGAKLRQLLDRHRLSDADQLAAYGYYRIDQTNSYIEYETSTDLRDSEQVPLVYQREAGLDWRRDNLLLPYFTAEVAPHVPEAWINGDSVKIGYEISFNKHFYRHTPLRSLEAVTADILRLEEESEGLIKELLG